MNEMFETLRTGLTHHQAGRFPEAERCYRQVLEQAPRQPDAWGLLGMLAQQCGHPQIAIEYLQRAIECGASNAATWNNLGEAYRTQGQNLAAREAFDRSLSLDPTLVEAHNNLGNLLKSLGDVDGAIAHYRRAIEVRPQYSEAYNNLGTALQQRGRRDEAEQAYLRSRELNPGNPEVLYNLALLRQDQQRIEESESLFLEALRLRPQYAEAYNQLGIIYYVRGMIEPAIVAFQQAIRLRPNFAEVYNNLGMMHYSQGRRSEARGLYEQSLRLKPNDPEALNNYGTLLNDEGQSEEAVATYRRALELKPDFPQVHNNLGLVYYHRDQSRLAKEHLSRAIALKPDYADAHNHLGAYHLSQGEYALAQASFERAIACQPNNADVRNNLGNLFLAMGDAPAASEQYQRALEIRPSFALAHSNYLMSEVYRPTATLERLAQLHAEWDERHARPFRAAWPDWPNRPDPDRPLRLGFVSADLGRHPIGHLLVEMLPRMNPAEYQAYCYFNRAAKDQMTERLKSLAAGWLDVHAFDDDTLARRIQSDAIDVLFDLSGHTAKHRLLTFARKPAPVQVTWMGYPSTTGLEAIDYLIADGFHIPPEHDRWFRERIVRLPEGMAVHELPEGIPDVGPLPALAQGLVTFASFNNPAKISPQVVAVWAGVLQRVPGSRLFMKFLGLQDEFVQRRYRELFATHGIGAERLTFQGRTPLIEMLTAYHEVDIALDPFPYTGGTSSILALAMGVPVITWPGETFASRQSYSVLSNMGLTELVAHDADDYVARAVALAKDLPRLEQLRRDLRGRFLASSYGDPQRFLSAWLPLVRDLWRRWCAERKGSSP